MAKGVNIKTFEICAAGGFQLSDNPEDLGKAFDIGRELDVFENAGQFREKVDFWLAHDEERARVASAGQRRVTADHTMRARIDELMRILA